MKLKIIGLSIFLLVLAIPSASLAASPSARNARRATFKEINNTQASNEGIERNEENNIHCNRLTSTKYHCTFMYLSPADVALGCVAGSRGSSYVMFDRYGTEVNLHMSNNVCVERHRD